MCMRENWRRATDHLGNSTKMRLRLWFRDNAWALFFCVIAVVVGVVIGVLAVADPLMSHIRVSENLIDGNIINAINPDRGMFVFMLSRFFDTFLKGLLIFIVSLTVWTKWIAFPLLALRGYWIVVNLFWIMNRFGISGILLAITYLIILIIALAILVVIAIYVFKLGKYVGKYGFRCLGDNSVLTTLLMFTCAVLILAFTEWLLYFLILSRMVFPQG